MFVSLCICSFVIYLQFVHIQYMLSQLSHTQVKTLKEKEEKYIKLYVISFCHNKETHCMYREFLLQTSNILTCLLYMHRATTHEGKLRRMRSKNWMFDYIFFLLLLLYILVVVVAVVLSAVVHNILNFFFCFHCKQQFISYYVHVSYILRSCHINDIWLIH